MRNSKYRKMVQISLLIALQVVLTVTPLGFLTIGPLAITLVHIPVLVGALTIGPSAGGMLGLVFGISSMITANIRGSIGDIVFSPLLSGSMWSVVIAVVPRVLFGLIAAYLFRGLRKIKMKTRLAAGVSAGVGTLLHTIMVLGSIYLFLGELYAANMGVAKHALIGMFGVVIGTNGVIEAIVAVLVCMALTPPLLLEENNN